MELRDRTQSIFTAGLVATLLITLLAACSDRSNTPTATDDTMVAVSRTECPSTDINGTWRLLYTTKDGKTTMAAEPTTLTITDCSNSITHTDAHTCSESFTVYRMKRYCADYQLTYPNDSIACITLHGDTLAMGECNNFGETRWYYGRVK
ncbi:MAG: hypothetical protein KF744_08630 [Taibaiella sp.]|nr:hypothetical protein [Taibaiella sp.]